MNTTKQEADRAVSADHGLLRAPFRRPRHWSRVVAIVFILASVGAGVVGLASPRDSLWATIGGQLAISCLTVGLLTAIVATKLEKLEGGLLRSMGVAKEFGTLGLVEVCPDSSTCDYSSVILGSRKLVILLNDGRTWASVHRDRLRKRFADPNKETTIFLIHPDSSMLKVLGRKGGRDLEAMRARLQDTVELLEEIKEPHTSLEILGHHLFNPHSLVLGDTRVLITPYFVSRGGRTVPTWCFEDTHGDCYFRAVLEDMERLRMDAESLRHLPAQSHGDKSANTLRFLKSGD